MGRDAKRRERKQGELQKRIDASYRSEYGKMQAEGENRFDGGGGGRYSCLRPSFDWCEGQEVLRSVEL